MKTINLINTNKNSIQESTTVNVIIYSDSQVNVTMPHVQSDEQYTIVSRFSNYTDLFTILEVNQILRYAGVKYVRLVCPYILGGRSDARFKPNQGFSLKIIADIINSCNFDRVIVLDPHSAVTPALINNCKVHTVEHWFDFYSLPKDAVLVSPDAGAYKKMVDLADTYELELVAANKSRGADGIPRITVTGIVENKHCYIVDDICDGGRTFTALAEKLKKRGAAKVTLIVTHGLFSYGYVLPHVDNIYTTDSYKEFKDLNLAEPFFNIISLF